MQKAQRGEIFFPSKEEAQQLLDLPVMKEINLIRSLRKENRFESKGNFDLLGESKHSTRGW